MKPVMPLRLCLILSVLSLPSYAQTYDTSEDVKGTSELNMFALMTKSSRADHEPLSFPQAYEQSSLVVTGYLKEVHPGLKVRHNDVHPNSPYIESIVFEVSVTEVLKGDAGADTIYFEYPKGGIPRERYESAMYKGEIMLSLRPQGWEADYSDYSVISVNEEFINDIKERFYELTTPSGFFIEDKGKLLTPLNENSELQRDPILEGQSMDTLKERYGG